MLQLSNNSVLFSLAFFMVYWVTRNHLNLNNWLLFVFGLVIYAWGHVFQGVILFVLTLIDFLIVRIFFADDRLAKKALIAGLIWNVASWLLFKYAAEFSLPIFDFGSVLGISFFTLRKISMLLHAYKHREKEQYGFLDYGLFISFFPQLLSGPIELPGPFLAQISKKRMLEKDDIWHSSRLIILGLLKKIVIADNIRVIVDRIFLLKNPSWLLLYIGTVGFALQLFCDFSGYTDISRAAAVLLGFKPARNFNHPFLALTPSDFWNRWHITFTRWLQSTIFFPLQRYIKQKIPKIQSISQYILPILIMVISGFWHGNGWKFILWGFYNGILIAVFRALRIDEKIPVLKNRSKYLLWLLNTQLILAGWFLFRMPNLAEWFSITFSDPRAGSYSALLVALSIAFQISLFSLPLLIHFLITLRQKYNDAASLIFYPVSVILILLFSMSGFREFIYFGF